MSIVIAIATTDFILVGADRRTMDLETLTVSDETSDKVHQITSNVIIGHVGNVAVTETIISHIENFVKPASIIQKEKITTEEINTVIHGLFAQVIDQFPLQYKEHCHAAFLVAGLNKVGECSVTEINGPNESTDKILPIYSDEIAAKILPPAGMTAAQCYAILAPMLSRVDLQDSDHLESQLDSILSDVIKVVAQQNPYVNQNYTKTGIRRISHYNGHRTDLRL